MLADRSTFEATQEAVGSEESLVEGGECEAAAYGTAVGRDLGTYLKWVACEDTSRATSYMGATQAQVPHTHPEASIY